MAKFAKLFELENDEQVLVTLKFDNQQKTLNLIQRADIYGCVAEIKIVFDTEEKAQAALDSYSVDNANSFYKEVSSYFN